MHASAVQQPCTKYSLVDTISREVSDQVGKTRATCTKQAKDCSTGNDDEHVGGQVQYHPTVQTWENVGGQVQHAVEFR